MYFVFGGAIVLVGLDNFCFLLRKGYAATKTHISRNSGAAPRESRDCCAPCLALTGRYGPAHTRAAPRTLREGARRGCPQDDKGGRTQGLPPGDGGKAAARREVRRTRRRRGEEEERRGEEVPRLKDRTSLDAGRKKIMNI